MYRSAYMIWHHRHNRLLFTLFVTVGKHRYNLLQICLAAIICHKHCLDVIYLCIQCTCTCCHHVTMLQYLGFQWLRAVCWSKASRIVPPNSVHINIAKPIFQLHANVLRNIFDKKEQEQQKRFWFDYRHNTRTLTSLFLSPHALHFEFYVLWNRSTMRRRS